MNTWMHNNILFKDIIGIDEQSGEVTKVWSIRVAMK